MINNLSSAEDVVQVADRMVSVFDHPFKLKGQDFYLTTSAGISLFPLDGEDVQTLVQNADVAMYGAKDKGKNQYMLLSIGSTIKSKKGAIA